MKMRRGRRKARENRTRKEWKRGPGEEEQGAAERREGAAEGRRKERRKCYFHLKINIIILTEHIYSTIHSFAKVTCNTHTPTKTRTFCPSLLSSFPH